MKPASDDARLAKILSALEAMSPRELAQFALEIHVSERTVYRWVTGRHPIRPALFGSIENALRGK